MQRLRFKGVDHTTDMTGISKLARLAHSSADNACKKKFLKLSREEMQNPDRFVLILPDNPWHSRFQTYTKALLSVLESCEPADIDIKGARSEATKMRYVEGIRITLYFSKRGQNKILELFRSLAGEIEFCHYRTSSLQEWKAKKKKEMETNRPLLEDLRKDNVTADLRFISDGNSVRGVIMKKGPDVYSYFVGAGFLVNGKPADRVQTKLLLKRIIRGIDDIKPDGNGDFDSFIARMEDDAKKLPLASQKADAPDVKAEKPPRIEFDPRAFDWKKPEKTYTN